MPCGRWRNKGGEPAGAGAKHEWVQMPHHTSLEPPLLIYNMGLDAKEGIHMASNHTKRSSISFVIREMEVKFHFLQWL